MSTCFGHETISEEQIWSDPQLEESHDDHMVSLFPQDIFSYLSKYPLPHTESFTIPAEQASPSQWILLPASVGSEYKYVTPYKTVPIYPAKVLAYALDAHNPILRVKTEIQMMPWNVLFFTVYHMAPSIWKNRRVTRGHFAGPLRLMETWIQKW
ncbi:hypothetical protein B0H13DRAFT_1907262 [Mycena leptocephala]|nr:hypothetical protein B0H13DRAFT_1907262 [Mycena leptocephala]